MCGKIVPGVMEISLHITHEETERQVRAQPSYRPVVVALGRAPLSTLRSLERGIDLLSCFSIVFDAGFCVD